MFQRIGMTLLGVALLVACGSAGAPVDPPSTGNQDPVPSSNQPLVGSQPTGSGSVSTPSGNGGSDNTGSGNNKSCSTSDSCSGCDISSDCNAYCECQKQLAGSAGNSVDCGTICSNI